MPLRQHVKVTVEKALGNVGDHFMIHALLPAFLFLARAAATPDQQKQKCWRRVMLDVSVLWKGHFNDLSQCKKQEFNQKNKA